MLLTFLMEEKLLNLKASELLSKFGAGNATPGSGSAAALQGILAAQLLLTVIELTNDSRRFASYSHCLPRLLEIKENLQLGIIPNLEQLFQDDSDQFDVVIRLRTEKDKATEALTKRQKNDEVLSATVIATEYPIQIARNCVELGKIALEVFDLGFKSARGDSGVAVNLAISGIAGSLSIIELNLLSFSENGWTKQIRETCDILMGDLDDLQYQSRQRLLSQRLQAERHGRFSQELQEIEKLAKGKKKLLSKQEIERLVTRLQRFLWVYRDLIWKKNPPQSPFDALNCEVALKIFGFRVRHCSTLGNFVNRGSVFEIAGQIDQKNHIVSISDQFPSEVRNFTLAHELGHSLLHNQEILHRDRPLDGSNAQRLAPEEWQADKFASYFLMPEKLVRKSFSKIFLTHRFQVSHETAQALAPNGDQGLLMRCRNRRELSRLLSDTSFYNSRAVVSLSQRFNVSTEAMAIRLEELELVEF